VTSSKCFKSISLTIRKKSRKASQTCWSKMLLILTKLNIIILNDLSSHSPNYKKLISVQYNILFMKINLSYSEMARIWLIFGLFSDLQAWKAALSDPSATCLQLASCLFLKLSAYKVLPCWLWCFTTRATFPVRNWIKESKLFVVCGYPVLDIFS